MFNGLFNKSGKHSAAVFVDYEHWYYGYNNIFSMKPNVEEWYEELTEEYSVKNIVFFGDFHGNSIEKELPRLEKITKNVVHTASTKDGVDKDFTDFIILDAIYREAAKKNCLAEEIRLYWKIIIYWKDIRLTGKRERICELL